MGMEPHARMTEDAEVRILEEAVQTSYRKGGEQHREPCKPCAVFQDEYKTNGMEEKRDGENGRMESLLL